MSLSTPVAPAPDTPQSWVSKSPDTCGGEARIRNTRITVWGLVAWKRQGLSDAEIMEAVEGLRPADLNAAWEYEDSHMEEIDRAIRENEAD
jgi:uncharacterized protein (DUF433 family)